MKKRELDDEAIPIAQSYLVYLTREKDKGEPWSAQVHTPRKQCTKMEEKHVTRNALEQRFTDGWLDEETYSKSLQDEHQMRQEYHHALQVYAQGLRHHHQRMHNLCQAILNHTIADRDLALQDYHQAIQEHDDMTQSYQQRVLDYWRMVREHRRRAFPFQHPYR